MPELPDLVYIQKRLTSDLVGRRIDRVDVSQPVIVRSISGIPLDEGCTGRSVLTIDTHGPFLRFELSGGFLVIINLMLAGRLQLHAPGEKPIGHRCVTLALDNGALLHVCDDKLMAKLYFLRDDQTRQIPRYLTQGVGVLSPQFTAEKLRALAALHGRKQIRVMLTDQTVLSAIGNAYADEILFEACIHPKTFVARLSIAQLDLLHSSIRSVLRNAILEVERSAQPIQVKVRDHLKVRNRHGQPCPRCGTTIRREGVRGYDVFFCPACQPPTRSLFVDWNSLKKGRNDGSVV
jgi:formamidopyrimidine-DNA glycosylase